MSTTADLVALLKTELKTAGITYAQVAQRLGMAESSVKRMFSKSGDMPLSRIDEICRVLNMDFADLARRVADTQPLLLELTLAQERAVVADRKLLIVAICVTSQLPAEEILATYRLTEAELVKALTQLDRIGTIAQTTISPKKYRAILDALREKSREVKVCETICDATEENQRAIREMSDDVDLLYVIGGRHSANSNKLVETAREKCPRATLIETAEEINPEDLQGVERVGVSAGASTPDWMIRQVVERLREIEKALANPR